MKLFLVYSTQSQIELMGRTADGPSPTAYGRRHGPSPPDLLAALTILWDHESPTRSAAVLGCESGRRLAARNNHQRDAGRTRKWDVRAIGQFMGSLHSF